MKKKLFNALFFFIISVFVEGKRTNFVLLMADDLGWGQTGYYDHAILRTPNLNAMASNGLRFDRFYAGGPVCSPTRATILTGRTHDRTGVFDHGYALRKQERTLPQALREKGYATGHFGKWHLNGLRGPGVPILFKYPNGPSDFGFQKWLSVSNYFDLNPLMSREGKIEEFLGDSSEIIVKESLRFIENQVKADLPFLAVIWYGTPHSPWMALKKDEKHFQSLNSNSKAHYSELRAMDRSIGTLRSGLRKMKVEKETLLWFCSDNGGLPKIEPSTTGILRDFKGSLYEGGLRVPAVVEWPEKINDPRITSYPAGAVDIFPTIAEIADLPEKSMLYPIDGESLMPLFGEALKERSKPLVFSSRGRMAVIDNQWKLISQPLGDRRKLEMFDLSLDPSESNDLFRPNHSRAKELRSHLLAARKSISDSVKGLDYAEKKVMDQPPRIFWTEVPQYKKYFSDWKNRPEYKKRLRNEK